MVFVRTQPTKLFMDGKQSIGQVSLGVDFKGRSVVARRQDSEVNLQYTGEQNVYIGYDAGVNNNRGDGNVMIGYRSGFETRRGTGPVGEGGGNTFVGTFAGLANRGGRNNINVGNYSGAVANGSRNSNTVNVGNSNGVDGSYVILVGSEGAVVRNHSVVIGNNVDEIERSDFIDADSNHANVMIGHHITNYGRRSLLLYPNRDNAPYVNELDDYLDLFGVLRGRVGTYSNIDDGLLVAADPTDPSVFQGVTWHEPVSHARQSEFCEGVVLRGQIMLPVPGSNTEVDLSDTLRELYYARLRNREYFVQQMDAGAFVKIFFQQMESNALSLFENDIAPWLSPNQADLRLSGFDVDLRLSQMHNDLAPWIETNLADVRLLNENLHQVDLSALRNDADFRLRLENFAGLDFDAVRTGTDVLPPWLRADQHQVRLADFDVDQFASEYLSTVDLGVFRIDESYTWLRRSQV